MSHLNYINIENTSLFKFQQSLSLTLQTILIHSGQESIR